jgi:hypothetical protein
MRKSVSRVITNMGGRLTAIVNKEEEAISYWEVEDAFGEVPGNRYKVTYTLNKKGRYLLQDNGSMAIVKPGQHRGNLCVCWLPKGWHGERVNRSTRLLPRGIEK